MTVYEKVVKELIKANRNTVIVMIASSVITALITVFIGYDKYRDMVDDGLAEKMSTVWFAVAKECWFLVLLTIIFTICIYYAVQTYKNMKPELDGILEKTGMTEDELAARLETMDNIAYLMYVDDDYLINFPVKTAVDMHKAADVEILTSLDNNDVTKYYVELRLKDTSTHRLRICSKKKSAEELADRVRKYIKT